MGFGLPLTLFSLPASSSARPPSSCVCWPSWTHTTTPSPVAWRPSPWAWWFWSSAPPWASTPATLSTLPGTSAPASSPPLLAGAQKCSRECRQHLAGPACLPPAYSNHPSLHILSPRTGRHWWWVPIVSPLLGSIAGVVVYQTMIGCHLEQRPPSTEEENVKLAHMKHKEQV